MVGNANGITIAQGAERNTFLRNFVNGNPPVQVAVDHASNSGVDIRNLSGSETNTFIGNICATSVNAPCPALAISLTASPNPIPVTGSNPVGTTTINWNAPGAEVIEIRVGSPGGSLLTRKGSSGSEQTGLWVTEGMTFYLQDVSRGRPLTAENTLATLVVRLQRR